MPGATVTAPAKLNLYLHVTGRRNDGYHTLNSLVAFAGLADAVAVETRKGGGFSLTFDGPFAAALEDADDNLILRAARALAVHAGPEAGADIHLTKNIPVAAGLGGGSADAAAALLALDRLWGTHRSDLADIALALGADVPVCLAAAPARVGGIGEKVEPAGPLPDMGLLLVNPGTGLATRSVFMAADTSPAAFGASAPAPGGPFADADALLAALAGTGNDLDTPARAIAPAIGRVLEAMGGRAECRLVRMSGSGATCFGLYDDAAAAERAADAIRAAQPGWWVWAGGFAAPRDRL